MPTPDEPAIRDTDHLFVRMIQRGQQHVSLLDPGQQHAEHRRRVQAGRRVEVEVQRGTGDHRERELGVGEPEIARVPLDTDRDAGRRVARTSLTPCRVRSRVAVNRTRSTPSATVRSSTTPSGSTASPSVNERVHDTQIFVVSAPPMRFALAVRRRFPACLTAGVDAAAVLELLEGRRLGWSLPGPMYHDADVFAWTSSTCGTGSGFSRAWSASRRAGGLPDAAGRGLPPRRHARSATRRCVRCTTCAGTGDRSSARKRRAGPAAACVSLPPVDLRPPASRRGTLDAAPASTRPASACDRTLRAVGGLVYVCLAADPPDVATAAPLVEPYLAPSTWRAIVAHRTTFVEHANWKLVMENNRECYHCRLAHPELCVSFPAGAQHNGAGTSEQLGRARRVVARAEAAGLPSRLAIADDHHLPGDAQLRRCTGRRA